MIFEGHAPITGLSFIVTMNAQLEFPQVLDAVQVTVVAPVANVEPDAGTQVTVATGVEVGVVNVTT